MILFDQVTVYGGTKDDVMIPGINNGPWVFNSYSVEGSAVSTWMQTSTNTCTIALQLVRI